MKTKVRTLKWCNNCKEKSMVVKIYKRRDMSSGRIQFCLNKGCGSSFEL